jgi:hypothetical protein
MNTAELKYLLKLKIDSISDIRFLNALNTLIESKTENTIVLSEEQRQKISNSQKEYSEGSYYDNTLVNEEIEKWLQEE